MLKAQHYWCINQEYTKAHRHSPCLLLLYQAGPNCVTLSLLLYWWEAWPMPFTTCTRFIYYYLTKRINCVTLQRSGTAFNCKCFVYVQKYIAPYLFGKKKSKLDLLEEAIAELKTNSEATLTSVREFQQQQQRSVAMNAWNSGRVLRLL